METENRFLEVQIAAVAQWWHGYLSARLAPHLNKWYAYGGRPLNAAAPPSASKGLSRLFGFLGDQKRAMAIRIPEKRFYLGRTGLSEFRTALKQELYWAANDPDLPRSPISHSRYILLVSENGSLPQAVNDALAAAGIPPQVVTNRWLREDDGRSTTVGTCIHDNGLMMIREADDGGFLPVSCPGQPALGERAFMSIPAAMIFTGMAGPRTACFYAGGGSMLELSVQPVTTPFQVGYGDSHAVFRKGDYIAFHEGRRLYYRVSGEAMEDLLEQNRIFPVSAPAPSR